MMELEFWIETVTPHTVIGKTTIDKQDQSNAGCVALNNFIVTIDPGPYPRSGRLFRKEIEEKFQLPVKYLLVTHNHGDHVFGVPPYKSTQIFGSKKLVEEIDRKLETGWNKNSFERWKEQEPDFKEIIEEIEIIKPQITFSDVIEIRDDDLSVEIYHVGGHTVCSSYAYFPQEKVLFSGDLIFAKTFPWAGDVTCNPEKWIDSLKDFLNIGFDKLIPGHGPVVGKEEVEKHLDLFINLRKLVKKAIDDNSGIESIETDLFSYLMDWDIPERDKHRIPRAITHWYDFYKNKA